MFLNVILLAVIGSTAAATGPNEISAGRLEQTCLSLANNDLDTPQKQLDGVACATFIAGFVDGVEVMNAITKAELVCINEKNKDTLKIVKNYIDYLKYKPEHRTLPAKLIMFGIVGMIFACNKEL